MTGLSPVRLMPCPAHKKKKEAYIPPKDLKKLLATFDLTDKNDLYYYTIIYVLYWTGLRIGELTALTPEDFKTNYM